MIAKGAGSVLFAPLVVMIFFIIVGIALPEYGAQANIFTLLGFLMFLALLMFFRDPVREIGDGIIAPADGRIMKIDQPRKGIVRVATFMNVHNVHVNRAPMSGRVKKVMLVHGGKVPAYDDLSEQNERVYTRLETEIGEIEIVQIIGIVARRIVPYIRKGQMLKKGDKIGIIRLGSRVDVFMPIDKVKIKVLVGEKVLAGVSQIAEVIDE